MNLEFMDLLGIAAFVLGGFFAILKVLLNQTVKSIGRDIANVAEDVQHLDNDFTTYKKDIGGRVGELEKRVTLEYATKQELQMEHKAITDELTNLRRLVEKIFDKIDSIKDTYVSTGTCNEHRSHCRSTIADK